MNISFLPAELISYKLIITDRTEITDIHLEIILTFQTGDSYTEDAVKWFEEHLTNDLQAIPAEERNTDSILSVVRKLMSETPFSHSYKVLYPIPNEKIKV